MPPDDGEPGRVALAARDMGLKYVVVTSVTRDDLPDGGALHFSRTVAAIKDVVPAAKIEVLTPDFKGNAAALKTVLESGPDVFNHNVETVPRLYQTVRPQADYERSLGVLRTVKRIAPWVRSKSGFMVGLGETFEEVLALMQDILLTGCDYLTIGQYLRPSIRNLPVAEYIAPATFEQYRETALAMGFRGVASGPLVRSSLDAEEMFSP